MGSWRRKKGKEEGKDFQGSADIARRGGRHRGGLGVGERQGTLWTCTEKTQQLL